LIVTPFRLLSRTRQAPDADEAMGRKKEEPKKEEPKSDEILKDEDEEEEEEDSPCIKQLKAIDEKYVEIEVEFEREVQKLRQKFRERQAPLLEERAQVLSDASACEAAEDGSFATPACKGFWLRAMQHHEAFEELLEEWDDPVLEYLRDIKRTYVQPDSPFKGFKLEFFFVENPFFTNESLWVEFRTGYDPEEYKPYKDVECTEMKSSTVDWKQGNNVTVELVEVKAKKAKGGGAKKTKAKKVEECDRDSFFRGFFRTLKKGDPIPTDINFDEDTLEMAENGDSDKLLGMVLENSYNIAQAIGDQLVPYAVRYYTGEAGFAEDDSDDDDDEDDEEEEAEDESEEEAPKPTKKSPKLKPQKTGDREAKDDDKDDEGDDGGGPKKGGSKKDKKKGAQQAKEECKQQ